MATVERALFTLTLSSALGCGLVAGVFFAFSAFVMSALARLRLDMGLAAMQSINNTVVNSLFMAVFLGTAAACFLLMLFSVLRWHSPGSAFLLVGSLLYLAGSVLVTIVFNVPLNDALARVEPGGAGAERLWTNYLAVWTAWNHVRAIVALAAASSFILALYQRR